MFHNLGEFFCKINKLNDIFLNLDLLFDGLKIGVVLFIYLFIALMTM